MDTPVPPIGEPRWGPAESQALRLFLLSPAGEQFLRRLMFLRPLVQETRDGNRRRVLQDERTGFEKCIDETLRLAEPDSVSSADVGAAQQATQLTTAVSS